MNKITVASGGAAAVAAVVTGSLWNASGDPIVPTANRPQFNVVIHMDTQAAVIAKCNALHAWAKEITEAPRGHAIGCNAFYEKLNTCEIWTPTPTKVDDPATTNLGHETMHCYAGEYHS